MNIDLNPESYKYLLQNANQNHCHLLTNHEERKGEDEEEEKYSTGIGCYNMDGRDFITMLKNLGISPHHVIMNLPQSATEFLDAFIGFSRSSTQSNSTTNQEEKDSLLLQHLPIIHVYAFSTSIDDLPSSAVRDVAIRCAIRMRCSIDDLGEQRVIAASGTKLANITLNTLKNNSKESQESLSSFFDGVYWGHIVRDVAPTKVMVCLSFRLPRSVALSE